MHQLRRRRIAVGHTQTSLAGKLKVVPSTVSQWESGGAIPSPRLIPKLAKLLQLEPMELTRIIEPELAGSRT